MASSDKPDAGSDTYRMYAGGEWFESQSGEMKEATSPVTGEVLGRYPDGVREDARRAIERASEAQKEFEQLTAFTRAQYCSEIADAIGQNRDELVELFSLDQGKPLAEAQQEVDVVSMLFREAGEHAKRANTEVYQSQHPEKRTKTIRRPHGVYGVITPWNVPMHAAGEYIAHGLAIGNTVVWSPAPTTTAVSAKLVEIIDETSLPPGALNFVTGDGPTVSDELVVNDGTDAIAFTGSPETGAEIASKARLKPTVLELGGNGPMVILDDANLETALECVLAASFTNAGQICTGGERILVHQDIHDQFVEQLSEAVSQMDIGSPLEEETDMGPLNNESVAEKIDRHVSGAVEGGATAVTGGQRASGMPTDLYYRPTVLRDVTPDMTVNIEETFGPVAPVVSVEDRDEALELANSIEYGLSMGVFTESIENMEFFVRNVESGQININDASTYWEPHTPIGGYTGTNSGHGRYGGMATIEEMSQVINVTVSSGNRDIV